MTPFQNGQPSGWSATTVGEISAVNPRSFLKPVDDHCLISFVPMAAVEARTGCIDLSQVRPYGEVSKGYTRFAEGDVLFAKITPCMENGKVAVARGLTNSCGCGSTEFHVLRPHEGLSQDFLYFFLLQDEFRKEAQRNMAGTAGQLRVSAAWLSEAPLPLPPLPEQRRIVAEVERHFTRLDASVAALRRAQANLKRYRASVLKDACEGRLVPTEAELACSEGREYEPAAVLLERILAERRARWESQEKRRGKYKEPSAPDTPALPQLPEGWAWANFEQLTSVIRNGYSKRPQGETGTPILRISAVRPMAVNLEDIRWVDSKENLSDFQIHPGDLLFTRYNGNPAFVGVCGVVPDGIRDTLHPDKLIRAALVQSDTMPAFVQVVANVGISREFLNQRVRTTAGQSGISGTDLKAIPIPLPPLAEQRRIVAEVERRLSVIQQAEAAVEASLARAERLRQSILNQAFSGKLVPQDPGDEPASALLERIRAEREAEAEAARAVKGKSGRGKGRATR